LWRYHILAMQGPHAERFSTLNTRTGCVLYSPCGWTLGRVCPSMESETFGSTWDWFLGCSKVGLEELTRCFSPPISFAEALVLSFQGGACDPLSANQCTPFLWLQWLLQTLWPKSTQSGPISVSPELCAGFCWSKGCARKIVLESRMEGWGWSLVILCDSFLPKVSLLIHSYIIFCFKPFQVGFSVGYNQKCFFLPHLYLFSSHEWEGYMCVCVCVCVCVCACVRGDLTSGPHTC
jgi:hypothetical protein